MIIETARLVLRPFKARDVHDLVLHLNNINVSRWLLVVPFPYTVSDAEWWVAHTSGEWAVERKSSYSFAVEYRESGALIGGCAVMDVVGDSAAVGYWLAEEYQKLGIGTEILQALINFSSNQLQIQTLWADVYESNMASRSLLKKSGFQKDDSVPAHLKRCSADGIEKMAIKYILRLNTQ